MVSERKQAFLIKKRKLQEEQGIYKEKVPPPPPKKKIKTGPNDTPLTIKSEPTPAAIKPKREKPEFDPDNKNSTLFVRNLSFKTTQEQLEAFFSAVSPVKHTVIITNPETKVSLGYGFVSFATPEDASTARAQLSMEKLDDRLIKIDFAEKRARKDEDKAKEKAEKKRERIAVKKEKLNSELIVRNLSFKIKNESQLRPMFEKFGEIKDIRVPRREGHLMAGFAFVVFQKHSCAAKAIEGTNGSEIDGRPIAVDWSVSKNDEPAKEDVIKEESNSDESSSEEVDSDDDDDDDDNDEDDFDEIEHGENPAKDVIKNDDSEESDDESLTSDTPEQRSATVFVRNLLFETTEQELYTFFREFGPLRYARLVLDRFTGRSRGSAFVCFVHIKDADQCLKLYRTLPKNQTRDATSLLLSEERKEGVISKFILQGRLLDVNETLTKEAATKAVDSNDAARRAAKGKGVDKRNLFLLNEGRIDEKHPLGAVLSEADKTLRAASYNQRKTLLSRNPGLHLSLTRLALRNIPKHIGDAELKYLARQAVVGFGQDVANKLRAPISPEEARRDSGTKGATGVVKQAKVVFEKDKSRSRGYGFISFASHRFALMALRWLNARQIGPNINIVEMKNAIPPKPTDVVEDRKRRLIVEFAIENVSIVKRRATKDVERRQKPDVNEDAFKEKILTPEDREKAKLGKIIAQKRMFKKKQRT